MQDKEYDIVIIGSGSGGGVLAAELSGLCRDGVRVAVLEWGPRLKRESYTGRELEMVGRLYASSGAFFTKDGNMTLAFCKAYGGSTVVYTGTSFVMRPETVEKWGVPGLGWDEINARSLKYFAANNVKTTPDELINENNLLFKKGCEALGLPVEKFPVNLRDCKGAGVCNLGCPHGAKQGTDAVQLPAAEKNGVEVVTCCKVERIGDREVLAKVSEAPVYAEPSAWAPGKYRIKARAVVVCGGTLNTCALLERSGLGAGLPMLGRRVTLHPALILAAVHDRRLTNYQGHPKSYCTEHFSRTDRFILETCFYFPFTTAKSCIGFGPEHEDLMSDMRRLQEILVLAWDSPDPRNRVVTDPDGEPVLDYKISTEVLDALHKAMIWAARIFFAAGASKVHAPAGERFFLHKGDEDRLESLIPRKNMLPGRLSLTSAHMMGGCAMGSSASDSVTDPWGRVHGVPWLFVADSSLFPTCSEVNPYITIMALADRVAEGIKKDIRGLMNP